MVEKKKKSTNIEDLQFAVYGGVCGIIGLLSLVILFFAVLECKPAIPNAIGRSILSSALGFLTIHFGYRARMFKEGKTVILLGLVILILVGILYLIGIIPCALS
jgi:hypothetical protein